MSSGLEGLRAVILCGGSGTRLREETQFKPKPMIEIGSHPILWHIMKYYREYGVRDFILCLGYMGDVIRDYFIGYRDRTHDLLVDIGEGTVEPLNSGDDVDWRVLLAETGTNAMTGRRIVEALKYIEGETFLATYGDGVANVDLEALLAHHRRTGKLATVTAVHPSSRFGELALSGDIVYDFDEKPQVSAGWINGGFFVFEKEAFRGVAPDANLPLETSVLHELSEAEQLAVYRHEGFWQCMDTYREMQLLNDMWRKGETPWRIW